MLCQNNDKSIVETTKLPPCTKKSRQRPSGRGGGRRADEGTVPARAATATRTVARRGSRVVRGKTIRRCLRGGHRRARGCVESVAVPLLSEQASFVRSDIQAR